MGLFRQHSARVWRWSLRTWCNITSCNNSWLAISNRQWFRQELPLSDWAEPWVLESLQWSLQSRVKTTHRHDAPASKGPPLTCRHHWPPMGPRRLHARWSLVEICTSNCGVDQRAETSPFRDRNTVLRPGSQLRICLLLRNGGERSRNERH